MLSALKRQYEAWNSDDNIHAILIKGNGGKAFCAGGDVKAVVLEMRAGRPDVAKSFFRSEYELNHYLHTLQKPHIALIDGIVMGGGAGMSINGPFRVATERTVFAMPECGIGLFPDVGASHFLNALRGSLGTYLALTGARLQGFQAVEAGIATHLIASSKLSQLETMLQDLGTEAGNPHRLESLFSALQEESEEFLKPSGLLDDLPSINDCFQHNTVEAIVAAVEAEQEQKWAQEALKSLTAGSPLSQKLTLREMQLGKGSSLAECLETEYRMVSHIIDGPSDFDEGIRALLIDRDKNPKWTPPTLDKVSSLVVDRFFEPLSPEEELHLVAPEARLSSRL